MTDLYDDTGGKTEFWGLVSPAQASYTPSITGGTLLTSIACVQANALRGGGSAFGAGEQTASPASAVNGDLIIGHAEDSTINQSITYSNESYTYSWYTDSTAGNYWEKAGYRKHASYNTIAATPGAGNIYLSAIALYWDAGIASGGHFILWTN
jgi:hypothetical protein